MECCCIDVRHHWWVTHVEAFARRNVVLSDITSLQLDWLSGNWLVIIIIIIIIYLVIVFCFWNTMYKNRTLDGVHFLVAAVIWIVFAVWMSHLFWVYQHRTLLVPMNIQLAVLMFLIFSAYNAEKTLRRNMPWYFISSFFFLLSDAIFGIVNKSIIYYCYYNVWWVLF